MGAYWPSGEGESFLASGLWNFHFFDEESWISANLGFGPANTTFKSPNVVTGGTGNYLGSIGRIETMVISSDPFVIQYNFCREESQSFVTDTCTDIYEWSSFGAGEIDGRTFSGSVVVTNHTGIANTPTFANASVESSPLIGRLVAQYFLDAITTASGSFNFQFFDPYPNNASDFVSINFGFGPLDTSLDGSFTRGTPNIVLGGTGQYAGITGSMRDRAVSSDPLVFEYQICPEEKIDDEAEAMDVPCRKIYEWSTGGNFGKYNFSGSVEYEGGALGVFDTPFFNDPDVRNADVAGRVMGYYVPNGGGAVAGNWNFAFFDHGRESLAGEKVEHEDWIAASLGFYQDGADSTERDGVPNIIMAGSGKFAGAKGTVTANVISSDPFVIEWNICSLRSSSDDDPNVDSIDSMDDSSSPASQKKTRILAILLFLFSWM